MDLLIGVAIGFFSTLALIALRKYLKQKKGVKQKDYNGLPFNLRLKDTIRHIVFEYDIKRKNNDFLLNIILGGKTIIQVMHRAHFPELCQVESDIGFGLAVYIPINELNQDQINKLNSIIDEETETLHSSKIGKLEYHILDLGRRIRFGGYLLSRILYEVFEGEESGFDLELFSEGNLAYWRN